MTPTEILAIVDLTVNAARAAGAAISQAQQEAAEKKALAHILPDGADLVTEWAKAKAANRARLGAHALDVPDAPDF